MPTQVLTGEALDMTAEHPILLSMCGRRCIPLAQQSRNVRDRVIMSLNQPGLRGPLNEAQKEAVLSVLVPTRPVQIVMGPPGTGESDS